MQVNNDHGIVTFISCTMRRRPAGCSRSPDQSALFKLEASTSPKNHSSPHCCFASPPFFLQRRCIRCLTAGGRQRLCGRKTHVFVVGFLVQSVFIWKLFFFVCLFFPRPPGHALCISEEKDPPHPSCVSACVHCPTQPTLFAL